MSPEKPLLIYDGDCNFCRKWIVRWQSYTKDAVRYDTYQKAGKDFPNIPAERFERSIQLIDPSGKTFEGAEAVFRTLAYSPDKEFFLTIYQKVPAFKWFSEWFYHLVARNRKFFSWFTRLFWGDTVEISTYKTSTYFFLKFVGVIYLIAFLSLWTQVAGLIGSTGILPAKEFLKSAGSQLGSAKYWVIPTLFWFNASDLFIHCLCGLGVLCSLLVIAGLIPSLFLFLVWLIYLSFLNVAQDFLSFQWDILLLEAGFLAIFLAPLNFRLRLPSKESREPKIIYWLCKWLLFRLMFSSGLAKLASGDAAWHNLTALLYHYETQPLPTWIAWFAHQLPDWFHQFSTAVMFVIELAVPFFIFAPRRARHAAAFSLISLQVLIMLTGNYCFFNLLAISLCLLLLDDAFWRNKIAVNNGIQTKTRLWSKMVAWPLAVIIFLTSLVPLVGRLNREIKMPILARLIYGMIYPLNIVNSYGLFAVMTTSRPEIIVEGSNDQQTWLPYEFKYKPGELNQRPKFIEPHQPRLDWQMWFAALGNYEANPWFINFCTRLLQGSPEVLKLIKKNPFPEVPPKYIRASVYLYHFTNWAEKRKDGTWWKRDYEGLYCPVLSLK